jgi:hypothetical protein
VLLAVVVLAGCVARGKSDSATIQKLEAFNGEGVFISRWDFHTWKVSLKKGALEVEGNGLTIADAYNDALKQREKLCADWDK